MNPSLLFVILIGTVTMVAPEKFPFDRIRHARWKFGNCDPGMSSGVLPKDGLSIIVDSADIPTIEWLKTTSEHSKFVVLGKITFFSNGTTNTCEPSTHLSPESDTVYINLMTTVCKSGKDYKLSDDDKQLVVDLHTEDGSTFQCNFREPLHLRYH